MALPVRRGSNDVTSWDPLSELNDIHSRFAKLIKSTFGETASSMLGSWTPPVNLEETDDAFIVEAELPDVKAEDVNVELNDSQLSIHGEIKQRERTGVVRRKSRRTGQFDYRVTLPTQVQPDSVEASLKNGVLRLKLHKSEVHKPRRIEISSDRPRRPLGPVG